MTDARTITYRRSTPVPVAPETLFAWHERPGAFERLTPPWEDVRVLERDGGIRDGDRTVLELRKGPFRRRWVAVHSGYVPGVQFEDEQESGPFAEWRHVHRVHPAGRAASVLDDEIAYRLPFGRVGRLVGGRLAARELDRLFHFRHARTIDDLLRHEAGGTGAMRIAVTGASGMIGSALVPFLTTGGHEVVRLVRGSSAGEGEIAWDSARGRIDARALEGVDALVHLSGEPIAKRWTDARRREILESRVESTRVLAEALAGLERKPSVLVTSSAIGYYGSQGDELLTESSAPGQGFLADVCRAWEDAAHPAREAGIRVVTLRTGLVLSARGGALRKLLPPFRTGVGGRIGSGRQWWSWIGLEDVLGAVRHALADESLEGAVNVTTPNPVTNAEFARTLGRVLGRPAAVPFPSPAVTALFGRMGVESLLASQRVQPAKLEAARFEFLHPRLEQALRHELGRP